MAISTMNSRTFARDAAAIKRAVRRGPVIITERGKPALAVLHIDEYYRLTGQTSGPSLLEAMQGIDAPGGIELPLPPRADAATLDGRIPDDLDDLAEP